MNDTATSPTIRLTITADTVLEQEDIGAIVIACPGCEPIRVVKDPDGHLRCQFPAHTLIERRGPDLWLIPRPSWLAG